MRPELNLVGAANHSKSNGSVCTGTNGIVNNSGGGTARARAMDEIHDYSEIYTPSGDKQDGLPFELSQPPPPPMHRYEKKSTRKHSFLVGFIVIVFFKQISLKPCVECSEIALSKKVGDKKLQVASRYILLLNLDAGRGHNLNVLYFIMPHCIVFLKQLDHKLYLIDSRPFQIAQMPFTVFIALIVSILNVMLLLGVMK